MNTPRFKRLAAFAALGIVFYVAFLIATAPAVWVAEGARRFTGGAVVLAEPSGTVWRGTGELHAGHSASGVRPIGTVRWRLSPWWLFAGAAQLDLALQGSAARAEGTVRVAPDYLRVRRLSAAVPASFASLLYGPIAFFEPTGTLEVRTQSIELTADGLTTTVEVQWQGAGGRFTEPTGIGDYRLELNGTGDTARLRLTTLSGELQLAGEGEWRVTGNGAFHFRGSATPQGDATDLEPLLRALGPDLGNGRRAIRLNARLPLVELLGY